MLWFLHAVSMLSPWHANLDKWSLTTLLQKIVVSEPHVHDHASGCDKMWQMRL